MKRFTIGYSIKKNQLYLISFLIPFAIMLGIFIAREVYPFGDESFLHIDMYHQYFPFLVEFFHKLKNGEGLFYSWNTGMGSNFLGLFVYYLATPFYWLAPLIPESHLMEFITYLVVLKIGLCGATFSYYLSRHFHSQSFAISLFATFYALSGYMAAYNWNVMWLDTLVLAPLIILGLERLVEEGNCLLYCITLTLAILSNYYISALICEFLVLYFIVLLAGANKSTMHSQPLRAPFLSKIHHFYAKAVIRFGTFSLFAGGMCAILLLPEFYALQLTEFSEISFPKKISSYFSVIDMLARHCVNVTVETGLDHWPNLYCGIAVFFLLPLYVIQKKIPLREKVPKLSLLFFMLISYSTNLLNFIWHGFNYPDSLPARQSFLYTILLLSLCYEAFLYIKEYSHTELLRMFGAVVFFLLLCEKLITDDAFTSVSFLLSLTLVIAYGILIHMYRNRSTVTRGIALFTIAIVIFEATENTMLTSVPTVSRSKYLAHFEDYEKLVQRTREADPDLYRFEKFKRVTQNDAMLIGFPSASLFSSTTNARVKDFYDKYGMKNSRVYYCYDGATPLMDALLAVRYKFSSKELQSNSLYQLIDEENGIYLYENQYALPLGFVVDGDIAAFTSSDEETDGNPFAKQNELVRKLSIEEPLFRVAHAEQNHDSAIIQVEESGYQYAYSSNKKVDSIMMTCNEETKKFTNIKRDYILDLGYFEAGDSIYLSSANGKDLDLMTYSLDEEVLRRVVQKLRSQTLQITSHNDSSLRGSIHVTTPGQLVLSIPYDPGWQVQVDGQEVDVTLFENMMISVPVTAGEHTISLHYVAQGFHAGIGISLFFVLCFLCVIWYSSKYAKAQEDKS